MSEEQSTKRLDIKPTQVAAGALASVTAAVLGSKLGVAGTVAGAGLASVVGTVGTAMYERSIQAAKSRVTSRIKVEEPPVGASHDAETVRLMVAPPQQEEAPVKRRWPMMVAGVLAAFVLGMGVLTVVELLGGQATSGAGNRTTVGALFGQPGRSTTPQPSSSAPTSTTTSGTTTSSPPPSTTSSPPPTSSSTTSSSSTDTSSETPTTTTTQQPSGTSAGPPTGAR